MTSLPYGMGWRPELLDIRDYRPEHAQLTGLLRATRAKSVISKAAKSPKAAGRVDLREWCSPIEDQGKLGSCTAHAAVALVEYFERRASGRHVDASRLFVYKVTRRLMGETGDTGAYLRDAMKALVLLGAPPEDYWPYVIADFDKEPPAFCYALGANWKSVKYFRLDIAGASTRDTLNRVKAFLVAGLPSMFGFTVYESIEQADGSGKIPFPTDKDRVAGGHAVVAVGYDDEVKIGSTKGALMIRNSWGKGWGEKGYGWLPYAYVESGLADDFWSVQSQSWVDTGAFA